LPLLVLRVLFTNDPVDAFPTDHLAVLAQLLDRGPNFHEFPRWDEWVLLESVNDAATGEIVWGYLDQDPVTRKDADEILSHLATDVREHLVLVLQLNPEYGIGQ
jgi:hypothetical protein